MKRGGTEHGPGDGRGAAFRARVMEVLFGREHSSLAGDIEEVYCRTVEARGKAAASFWFWSQVLRALPHYAYDTVYWRSSMLANYLKVALRVMKRQRSFTLINMAGLAAGMA
ncbi:MAG TPA: hypothetical protein VLA34_07240, partial [Candidatus Krumholzibacterium sp.]|nr:hypothetical protein [Candidatus Krumholzibacterium sp.]